MRNSLIQLFSEMEEELLDRIDKHLEDKKEIKEDYKWIKSSQVSEMLSCSASTLFRLRANGTLPSSLILGTYYYKLSDIEKMMEDGKLYEYE